MPRLQLAWPHPVKRNTRTKDAFSVTREAGDTECTAVRTACVACADTASTAVFHRSVAAISGPFLRCVCPT